MSNLTGRTPDFYHVWKRDRRNHQTPFKVIGSGIKAQRFETEIAARKFFNNHPGRALLSHCTYKESKVLAYKPE